MFLPDQNSRVVNGSRKPQTEDNRLQATVKEVFGAQGEDII